MARKIMFRMVLALATSLPMAIYPTPDLWAQSTRDPNTTPDVPTTPDRPTVTPDVPDVPTKGNDTTKGGDKPVIDPFDRTKLNRRTTQAIVASLGSFDTECGKYDPVYRIDCLLQGMKKTLAQLPKTGEYAEARKILQTAINRLDKIVTENADPATPDLVSPPGANPLYKKTRHYRAIRKDRLKTANAQAIVVIEEARTQLLRSSENSERRTRHYEQIAQAVGSTKVLLRSS